MPRWSSKELPPLRSRIGPIVGLLVLAPISAEYLIGYDSNIANPVELASGLLVLAPLYGCPALLIREVARRRGRGWPTILGLSFAAGLVQAGLIDQSLFNPDYRAIPYWADMREPTFIPIVGASAYMVYGFVGGHMIQSFAAPVALIEAMFPRMADRRWLGTPGVLLVAAGYLLAAAAVLQWHLETEGYVAPRHLLIGTGVVAVIIAVVSLTLPQLPRPVLATPRPLVVGIAAAAPLIVAAFAGMKWGGVLATWAALSVVAVLLWRWSADPGSSLRHVAAAASAPLVVNAAVAFVAEPLGDIPAVAKYVSNTVFAVGLVAFLTVVRHRVRRVGRRNAARWNA